MGWFPTVIHNYYFHKLDHHVSRASIWSPQFSHTSHLVILNNIIATRQNNLFNYIYANIYIPEKNFTNIDNMKVFGPS